MKNIDYIIIKILPSRLADYYVNRFMNNRGMPNELALEYIREKRNVKIGKYTYGFCTQPGFNIGGEVEIGNYCSIAGNVHYFGANHPITYVSQSALFYNKFFGLNVQDVPRSKLLIGHDVWIGYGVIITSGCKKIGNGAIIGAGTILTHDVPAYAIVAGNPGKILRYRFTEEQQKKLEKSKWWENEPEQLMEHYNYINNIEKFTKELCLFEE